MAIRMRHHEAIIAIIDRGQWKNSWHLPTYRYGYIDWWNPETERKAVELLAESRDHGAHLVSRCKWLLDRIEAETQKEDAGEDSN